MEPATIALLAFSSVLVIGSSAMIAIVNYRRFCIPQNTRPTEAVDWVNVSHNVLK
jgi:hypothetical protein